MKYISRKDHLRFLTSSISVFQMLCIFRGKWRRAWVNRRAPGFLPQISGPLGNDRHALADPLLFRQRLSRNLWPHPRPIWNPSGFLAAEKLSSSDRTPQTRRHSMWTQQDIAVDRSQTRPPNLTECVRSLGIPFFLVFRYPFHLVSRICPPPIWGFCNQTEAQSCATP